MIAGLKPYAEMRDSELPWLGDVPAHWKIMRAKTLLRRVDVRSSAGTEELLTVSSERGVVPRRTAKVTMFQAESYAGHKLCWPDDLVINSLWAWGKGLGVSQHHGIVSTAYGVYRAWKGGEVVPRYLHELVRSSSFHWELQVRSRGVWISRLQLTDESFLNAPLVVPPADEQAAIVRFLDHADRRIRRAIGAKQKLIKLLGEQKQAIIHHAVTRGLDPAVRLKPSGVEWLGDVPEHWNLRRLKALVHRVDQGVSPQAENQLADETSWGVLKAGCVNRGVFRQHEHKRLPLGYRIDESLRVSEGDVLVSRASGSPALVGSTGRVASIDFKLILSDKTFRLVLKDDVNPDFMALVMNGRYYRVQVEQAISGAEGLANNLPVSSLRSFLFAIPERVEQAAIVESLQVDLRRIDAAIDHGEREITLLREYRTRLIADVVTGKLDVREAAARLPGAVESTDSALDAELLDEGEISSDEIVASEAEDAEA